MQDTTVSRLVPLDQVTQWDVLGWSKKHEQRTEFILGATPEEQVAIFWKIGIKTPTAKAQTADSRFLLTRFGFISRKIRIEMDGTDSPPLGEFSYKGIFGKGVLTFPDGRKFKWSRNNVAGERWGFREQDGDVVLEFEKGLGYWTDTTWIRLGDDRVKIMPDISLFLVLGWYLILLMTFNEHGIVQKNAPPSYREFVR